VSSPNFPVLIPIEEFFSELKKFMNKTQVKVSTLFSSGALRWLVQGCRVRRATFDIQEY
jgi:predicted DNA-binding protein with PD1-like motif